MLGSILRRYEVYEIIIVIDEAEVLRVMNVEVYMGVYFFTGINMEANQKAGGQNANDCYDENEKEVGAIGSL